MKKLYNLFSISAVSILIIYQNRLIIPPLTWFRFLFFFSLRLYTASFLFHLSDLFLSLALFITLQILSSHFTDFGDSLWLLCEIQPPCYNLSLLYILSQAANCCLEFSSFCSLSPLFSLFLIGEIYNFAILHILIFFPLLWALKSWVIYTRNILIIF